jgi:hypothetical protein
MNKKILLALIAENSQELISNLSVISNLSHPNFEIELKVVVNLKVLTDNEKTLLENNSTAIITLQDNFELGKIHKIIFEYSRKIQFDFVILANLLQYEYLKSHLHELLDPLHPDLAYLTGGERVHSQFGIVNFIQQKVFQKQLNLFPKICIYNTHSLSKIPYFYNSNSASFINEIAIQIVLSDFQSKEIKSDLKTTIPTAVKLQTLKVFFRAYLHSLGIFYEYKLALVKNTRASL